MNITLNKDELTCLITDSAENPTKHCYIANWHPVELRPFKNSVELESFVNSILGNPKILSPIVEEPVAEEPVAP